MRTLQLKQTEICHDGTELWQNYTTYLYLPAPTDCGSLCFRCVCLPLKDTVLLVQLLQLYAKAPLLTKCQEMVWQMIKNL